MHNYTLFKAFINCVMYKMKKDLEEEKQFLHIRMTYSFSSSEMMQP